MKIKSWLLKELYCVPILEDVIRTKDKQITIGGEPITNAKYQKLVDEAYIISQTELWRLMTETVNDQAKRTMCEKSKSWEDMLGGKFMLYTIEVQKNIMKLFHN